MKKLDVNLRVLIAIIAFFGLSLSLMAQPNQRQSQNQHEDKSVGSALNLTDEQKTEMKEIHLAQMKKTQPLMDEVKINKAKINALLHNDNPDMKEIVSLVEADGTILTRIRIMEIEGKIKIRALLTDEQKVMFDAHGNKMQGSRSMAEHRPQRRTPDRNRF